MVSAIFSRHSRVRYLLKAEFWFSCLLATAISTAFAEPRSIDRVPPAEATDRDDGAMLRWLAGEGVSETGIPNNAPERWTRPMDAAPILPLLESVPGRPFYPVDPAPRSRLWHKYPFYVALGLPRDLIDAAFGVVGQIPFINVPVVGVAYEVIPTQLLIRDRRDWHGWGGTRNRRGHGWIGGKSWGWFPTANSMRFTYESEWKLRRNERRNAGLREELAGMNREFVNYNRVVAVRQAAVRESARFELSRANGREAVDWILPYHLGYPLDAEAHGLLLTSLALAAGQGSVEWSGPYLWADLARASPEVLAASEAELRRLIEEFPLAWVPAQALCYALTRLGQTERALQVARRAFAQDPGDDADADADADADSAGRARLLVEAALLAYDATEAYRGLKVIELAALRSPALPMPSLDPSRLESLRRRVAEAVGPDIARSTLTAGVEAERIRSTLVELKLRRADLRMKFVRSSNPMNHIDRHIARVEAMLKNVPLRSDDLPSRAKEDPVVARLQDRLLDLKLEQVDVGLRYRHDSAPMIDLRRRMKNVEKLLAFEINAVASGFRTNP